MLAEKDAIKRPFQCTWPGCTNSYARSEHLNRHKLNHEPVKIYECEYCPKTFVRSDLLFRHKDRHTRKAVKRSSPISNPLKSIRPARSDSNSSREEAGVPYPTSSGRGPESSGSGSYSSSMDNVLSRSLSHPRTLLQSPFSSTISSVTHQNSSFEDYASRHRSNTLPVPMPRHSPEHGVQAFRHGAVDGTAGAHLLQSPVLPPIRGTPKPRTYSVESMLNKPSSIDDSPFSEPVNLE